MTKRVFYCVLSLWATSPFQAQALQQYVLKDHQKTDVMVSSTETNRISLKGDRIHQVIGVEEAYAVETDEQGGQIFLKALFPEGITPSTLTLITEKGLTHDLRLKPCKQEAQSILLTPARTSQTASAFPGEASALLDFMRDMVLQKERDDVVLDRSPKEPRRKTHEIKGRVTFTYEDDLYKGLGVTITNPHPYEVSLDPQAFALPGDAAIAFQHTTLEAKGTTVAYVVRRKSPLPF